MPDAPTITNFRTIVHKVDHHNHNGPLLSDMESPLDADVYAFLLGQIKTNRSSRWARTAGFTDSESAPIVRSKCDAILVDNNMFVECSQELASHLFDSIRDDKRVSAGDLVICLFTEDNNDQWLALLKMDPEEGFVGEPENVDGQRRVVLRRVKEVLPRGELQKCAFVPPPRVRSEAGFDVIVIDQQAARSGVSQHVASFFMRRFLQCDVNATTQDRMRTFLHESYAWAEGKEDSWSQNEVNALKINASRAVEQGFVDAVAFAAGNIPDAEQQDDFVQNLRAKGLQDLVISATDQERAALAEYTWFRGDRGLDLKVRSDELGDNGSLYNGPQY